MAESTLMKKLLLGSLLASVALFIYGFISFALVGWHDAKPLKNDAVLAKAIKESVTEPGVYMVPSLVRPDGTKMNEEEMMKASQAGPFMLGVVRPGTNDRGMGVYMAISLGIQFVLALLLGFLLSKTNLGYSCMVKMGGGIGLFAALASWLPPWNWYEYPMSYAAPYFVDGLLQGIIASAILGKFIVKPGAKCPA